MLARPRLRSSITAPAAARSRSVMPCLTWKPRASAAAKSTTESTDILNRVPIILAMNMLALGIGETRSRVM